VALKQVFVSLGTGNIVQIVDDVNYAYPFKVLVTDVNSAPIPNVEVVLSIVPVEYYRGCWRIEPDKSGEDLRVWTQIIELGPLPFINEDFNLNGLLDKGEDLNLNGRLDPGAVVTFLPGEESRVEGNTVKVKTGNDGFADFKVSYFKENTAWVDVKITARTLVEGSEDSAESIFRLRGAEGDFVVGKTPPGLVSPFGSSPDCLDPKD